MGCPSEHDVSGPSRSYFRDALLAQAVRVKTRRAGDKRASICRHPEIARGLPEVVGHDAAGGQVFARRHAPALLDAEGVEAGSRIYKLPQRIAVLNNSL